MRRASRVPPPKHRDRSSASDPYILDPLLLPRLEQYSYNHSLLDVEACVEYLRRNYREYGRKQQAPFRRLVHRAVQVLQKRHLGSQARGRRSPGGDLQEFKLRQQEEKHRRRFSRDGSSGKEDVTSSGSDGSRDESEAVEDAIGSDSGGAFQEKEGSGGEGPNRKTRKSGKVVRASRAGRPKGKAGFASDSAEEEEALGLSPAFNLLNSSLRTTYHGRPALVFEKSDGEMPAVVQSPSPAPSVEAKQNQAFASPCAVAAAARAASKSVKKRPRHSAGSAFSGETPVDGRGPEVGEPSNSQSRAATTEGANLTSKSEQNLEKGDVGKQVFSVEKQACETIKIGGVSRQSNRAENTGHKKRSKGLENQDNAASVAKQASSSRVAAEAVCFSDLGGIDGVLGLIREITFPLYNPEIYPWLGLQPVGGILLHGPPGCGKTKLANAIAYEIDVPFLKISAPEIVSGMSGESEAKVRGLFAEAARLAPCIVFIDEIDAITTKRENAQREMERRIVTQLMTCMDDLNQAFQRPVDGSGERTSIIKSRGHVLVIGATNRPEALDPALRRPGRFDREISLGVPDENGRAQILSVMAKHLRLEGAFDFKRIARCTPGFVGADLAALTREAGSIAIKRIIASRDPSSGSSSNLRSGISASAFDDIGVKGDGPQRAVSESDHSIEESTETTRSLALAGTETLKVPTVTVDVNAHVDGWWKIPWTQEEMHALSITMQDFEEAVAKVQPSTKREGFSSIPDVKWEDVGALDSVQRNLEFFISRRITHPEDYQALGLEMDTGFLLYGPPGCGKTLVAKAVANDAQANFIYIKGPEILNKYVGESELAVRALFSRARSCAPCILFFDEMDALAPRRGTDGNAVAERVLNQLLVEMDGGEKRKGVFLIAATNRPDMIDAAILRPGRLGKLIYVPLPCTEGRLSILKTLTRQKPLAPDVDLASIAVNNLCEGFSGADLAALVNEACVAALQERIANVNTASPRQNIEPLLVGNQHFNIALSQISPSVSKQDLKYYESLPRKFNQMRGMKGIASETFS